MEESAEMYFLPTERFFNKIREIDNVVFDNDDIIRWRIEEMYDHRYLVALTIKANLIVESISPSSQACRVMTAVTSFGITTS